MRSRAWRILFSAKLVIRLSCVSSRQERHLKEKAAWELQGHQWKTEKAEMELKRESDLKDGFGGKVCFCDAFESTTSDSERP